MYTVHSDFGLILQLTISVKGRRKLLKALQRQFQNLRVPEVLTSDEDLEFTAQKTPEFLRSGTKNELGVLSSCKLEIGMMKRMLR